MHVCMHACVDAWVGHGGTVGRAGKGRVGVGTAHGPPSPGFFSVKFEEFGPSFKEKF